METTSLVKFPCKYDSVTKYGGESYGSVINPNTIQTATTASSRVVEQLAGRCVSKPTQRQRQP